MTVREFFENAWVPDIDVKIDEVRIGGAFTYFKGRFENGEPHGRWNLDKPPVCFMGLNVRSWTFYKDSNLLSVVVVQPERK